MQIAMNLKCNKIENKISIKKIKEYKKYCIDIHILNIAESFFTIIVK